MFEQSLVWLKATKKYMIDNNACVLFHCVFDELNSLVVLPLAHCEKEKRLYSLTSFYSATAQPFFFMEGVNKLQRIEVYRFLFNSIKQHNSWHSIHLGPLEDNAELLPEISSVFKWHRELSRVANWYQDDLNSFEQYYQQLPSKLKNTIKRKQKKLSIKYKTEVLFIKDKVNFLTSFAHYIHIYKMSWKGEEASFDFIKQVCLDALAQDHLRMGLLLVDGEPAAAQIWFINKEQASIFKLAYDPAYKEFSVGSILSMALSEYVLDQDNVHTIEFGMGNENYKKDWLKKSRSRVSFQVFNHKTLNGNLLAFKYIFLSRLKSALKQFRPIKGK